VWPVCTCKEPMPSKKTRWNKKGHFKKICKTTRAATAIREVEAKPEDKLHGIFKHYVKVMYVLSVVQGIFLREY